uniref:Top1 n=1 Tax=Arundo donax TaxID=35708 RepID=A0A0A9CQK3_ARUDO
MTILSHGWPFGTIQLAKRTSSTFSWQQAVH